MRTTARVGVIAVSTITSLGLAAGIGGSAASASTPAATSPICPASEQVTIPVPIPGVGGLQVGLSALSTPALYTDVQVCADTPLGLDEILSVNSLASGYLAVSVPPNAPVTIPIPLPIP